MLRGLYILLDDDFDDPILADPVGSEPESELWSAMCQAIVDGLEGDGPTTGELLLGRTLMAWRVRAKLGVSFVAMVSDDVSRSSARTYLQDVAQAYDDEVDDLRHPERAGLADVVVDVIPPWEA